MTDHPAVFSDDVLTVIRLMLPEGASVLDPFAGTGRIHELQLHGYDTYGIEIEPEWSDMHPSTIVGDALKIPIRLRSFDAIATSPSYGNRMADQYDGRDGSKRATYRIALGRELTEGSSSSMQWGDAYRDFHVLAWAEAKRVLKIGGTFVLNCKDHIRGGDRKRVTDWHVAELERIGLTVTARVKVWSKGNRYGANSEARIQYEEVIQLKRL